MSSIYIILQMKNIEGLCNQDAWMIAVASV